MKKVGFVLALSLLIFACGKDKKNENIENKEVEVVKTFNDSDYVLASKYPVGDVRRYGVFPDSTHNSGHPFTKKTRIETVLDLAQEHKIELTFPEGFYNHALVLKGRSNIVANFENAAFAGMIQVLEEDSINSNNINFKGDLITYGGFFTRNVSNISIENLLIKSDIEKSAYKIKSKGCHIYAASKNVTINNLVIESVGSIGKSFKYVNAGLTINGANTENIKIKKVHIKSSDKSGVIISGNDHLIGDVVVDEFGVGQVAKDEEFVGLFVDKCYNSSIESITINEKNSKGKYTAHFSSGNKTKPFTIGQFKIVNDNPKISILEEEGSAVIIESKE